MSAILAAVRPDDWNFPLLVHVLGAMLLVGGVVTAGAAQVAGWRRQEPDGAHGFARLSFWALLVVAIPGWIVMRVGAQWIASKEGWTGDDVPTWVDVGYVTAEPGGLRSSMARSAGLSSAGAERSRGEPAGQRPRCSWRSSSPWWRSGVLDLGHASSAAAILDARRGVKMTETAPRPKARPPGTTRRRPRDLRRGLPLRARAARLPPGRGVRSESSSSIPSSSPSSTGGSCMGLGRRQAFTHYAHGRN